MSTQPQLSGNLRCLRGNSNTETNKHSEHDLYTDWQTEWGSMEKSQRTLFCFFFATQSFKARPILGQISYLREDRSCRETLKYLICARIGLAVKLSNILFARGSVLPWNSQISYLREDRSCRETLKYLICARIGLAVKLSNISFAWGSVLPWNSKKQKKCSLNLLESSPIGLSTISLGGLQLCVQWRRRIQMT